MPNAWRWSGSSAKRTGVADELDLSVEIAMAPSWSHMAELAAGAASPTAGRPRPATARTAFAARCNIGVAAARPSVVSKASPSSTRSSGCGAAGSGGRARTARQISEEDARSPEMVRR